MNMRCDASTGERFSNATLQAGGGDDASERRESALVEEKNQTPLTAKTKTEKQTQHITNTTCVAFGPF